MPVPAIRQLFKTKQTETKKATCEFNRCSEFPALQRLKCLHRGKGHFY